MLICLTAQQVQLQQTQTLFQDQKFCGLSADRSLWLKEQARASEPRPSPGGRSEDRPRGRHAQKQIRPTRMGQKMGSSVSQRRHASACARARRSYWARAVICQTRTKPGFTNAKQTLDRSRSRLISDGGQVARDGLSMSEIYPSATGCPNRSRTRASRRPPGRSCGACPGANPSVYAVARRPAGAMSP